MEYFYLGKQKIALFFFKIFTIRPYKKNIQKKYKNSVVVHCSVLLIPPIIVSSYDVCWQLCVAKHT